MTKNKLPWLIMLALVIGLLLWLDNGARRTSDAETSPVVGGQATPSPIVQNLQPDIQPIPTEPAYKHIARIDAQADNPLAELDIESLGDMVERPLFAGTRRPPPVPEPIVAMPLPVEPSPPALPEPPNYALLGVIRDGERAVALLKNRQDGRNIRVEVGDVVGGWEISAVQPAAIAMRRPDGVLHQVLLPR